MTVIDIFHILQQDIHSTVFATVDENGLPQTCAIDLMLADEEGLYFLTARGKSFYERLDEILEQNPYMEKIYPTEKSRDALEVFQIYRGEGEYFDLSRLLPCRQSFAFGGETVHKTGYRIDAGECTGCQSCYSVCPQGCISNTVPREIDMSRCIHWGTCFRVCPVKAVEKLG